MSDVKTKKKTPLRRVVVRSCLIVVYVALMVIAFVFGKGHTLLVDNKDVEGMANLTAFDDVVVGVDSQKTSELASGDRDMFKVQGQRHRITLDIMGQADKVVKDITLPLNQNMVVLSLPKLVAGVEPAIGPFVQPKDVAPTSRDEETFTIGPADSVTAGTQETTDASGAIVPPAETPAAPPAP
jgi:hypothetical protein